jgi:WD40 repeat protein
MYARCVDFAPDGKTLISSGRDKAFRLWDVASGKQLRKWTEHQNWVEAVRFSPDGKLIVSGGLDRTIRFWESDTGKEVRRLNSNPADAKEFAFSPNGKTLFSGMSDGLIRLWNVADGTELPLPQGMMGRIGTVAFLPDGNRVVTGSDESIRVWDAATGKEIRRLTGKEPRYSYFVAVSRDGRLAGSGNYDEEAVRLWETCTGKQLGQIDFKGKQFIAGLGFSPHAKALATTTYEGSIDLWDVASTKRVRQMAKPQDKAGRAAFTPDGKMLVTASIEANGDHTIRFWDVATGKELRCIETDPWCAFDIAISPDGKLLAAVGGLPGVPNKSSDVRLWETSAGKELAPLHGHEERVSGLAFSPDGRTLATAGGDKTIRLWELATSKERARLLGHAGDVCCVAYSPDGRRLVSGSGDTTALVWDLTGKETRGRKAGNLSNAELDSLWSDLAKEDAGKAWQAIWGLALAPESAVQYLGRHLQPVAPADKEKIARWIANLDADDFATRRDAARELETLAELAEPALRKALEANPTQELRRQATRLLDRLSNISGERMRRVRAVETLEYVNTPDARQVLEKIAKGASEARLTREAKAALERVHHREK